MLLNLAYVRKCTRVRTLREKLSEHTMRGDAKAIVQDVIALEQSGQFDERCELRSFVKDLIHSLRLRKGTRGERSRGMRWSKASRRIFAIMRKLGGPRTLRFFRATLEAASDSTVLREWSSNKVVFTPGAHDYLFDVVGKLYRDIKAAKGIHGSVLYLLAEDDTTVPGASEYNQFGDSLVGTCGPKGERYQCDPMRCIIIGDGDDAFSRIESAWGTEQLAGYLRLMVVSPLHKGLPTLAVYAHATCNRFDHAWLRRDWQITSALAERYISPHLGEMIGRASDGDARRFKLQRADMSQPPFASRGRYGLDVEGFSMSARRLQSGAICDWHIQDPRHNLGKLINHLDSASRRLQWGSATASYDAIRQMADCGHFAFEDHQLGAEELEHADRQDKRAAAKVCSRSVRLCLQKMVLGVGLPRPSEEVVSNLPSAHTRGMLV